VWTVSASLPSQSRTGAFKVYLSEATSSSATGGSVRLTWAESGGSRRTNPSATVNNSGVTDAYLGEVLTGSSWTGWIETTGTVSFKDLVLVPADSVVEITGPAAGKQLNGAVTLRDSLSVLISRELNAKSFDLGSGSWSTVASGWTVSSSGATRTPVSMSTPVIATAGTGNPIDLDLRWQSETLRPSNGVSLGTGGLLTGAVARYVDSNNFAWAGWINDGTGLHFNARPYLQKRVGGTYKTLWAGEVVPSALSGFTADWNIQMTADGRWYIEVAFGGASQYASGQDADLASGATLGNVSSAKVGLIDQYSLSTPTMERKLRDFRVSSLVGVTPPPIPAGDTLTLSGPKMVNTSGAEYPYIGSSGIQIRPGANNNLTVMTRRSSGLLTSGNGTTDPLDIDIDGYPRFLSVPNA
jgi:hypothetical protein